MTDKVLSPRAERELVEAVNWIAEHNRDAARALSAAAVKAARRIAAQPGLARVELHVAPARFRFWSLRGFPYLLVLDTGHEPPIVARFVHQSRDLPTLLADL